MENGDFGKDIVDIVAVHGADPADPWCGESGRCWLGDLLKHDIAHARMATFAYGSERFCDHTLRYERENMKLGLAYY